MMASIQGSILKSPTVFVLGAGASQPYGFPLGNQLKHNILVHKNNAGNRKNLLSLGFDASLIDDFYIKLTYSSHATIDIFLEKKTDFRALGAHLIASSIMPRESHQRLFPHSDWYGDIFEALNFEAEDPDTSLLSVVTLNYDRSVEHFLYNNIEYNCQQERIGFAHEKRGKIKIVHAHGSLGKYPEVKYGITPNAKTLKNAADSIKIATDRLDDSTDFQRAQDLISQADSIIFLGFGYDERTLNSLLAKTNLDDKHIYGTAFGISDPIISRLKEYFGDNMDIRTGTRCRDYLQNIGVTGKGD